MYECFRIVIELLKCINLVQEKFSFQSYPKLTDGFNYFKILGFLINFLILGSVPLMGFQNNIRNVDENGKKKLFTLLSQQQWERKERREKGQSNNLKNVSFLGYYLTYILPSLSQSIPSISKPASPFSRYDEIPWFNLIYLLFHLHDLCFAL